MPNRNTIVVVGGDIYYAKPFVDFGRVTSDTSQIVERPEEIAFAIFTGGEDVDPSYYGEAIGGRTGCNPARDRREAAVFNLAKKRNVPMVGICRGSQFLCVMNGGRLAQHIAKHAIGGQHTIRTHDGRLIEVTSTHHQMQLPPPDATVIAVAEPRLSGTYLNGDDNEIDPRPEHEYEAVFYPTTRSLAIQWHPEYMDSGSDGFLYAVQLVREFILGQKE